MQTTAKISLEQYEMMVGAGAFSGKFHQHVELIYGELREMSPINPPHMWLVSRLNDWCHKQRHLLHNKFLFRIQGPISISALDCAPEPDIVWVEPREHGYRKNHPEPHDVILLIEVSDSSLDYDRDEKADLYAAAGIADYWIVNVIDRAIEVHREPHAGCYLSHTVINGDRAIAPLSFPSAALFPAELFADH